MEHLAQLLVAAPFELTKRATPYLLDSGRGSVVNITLKRPRARAPLAGFVSVSWQDLLQGRTEGGLLRGQGEPAAAAEAGEGAQAAARGAAVRVIAVRLVATAARDAAA